jgi:heat-inducible transcriptional repressor
MIYSVVTCRSLGEELKQRRRVIDRMLEAIDNLLDNSSEEKVIVSGALNIMNEPEFRDVDKLKKILTSLEEEDLLKNLFPDVINDNVNIRIGQENETEDFQRFKHGFFGFQNPGRTRQDLPYGTGTHGILEGSRHY